MKKLIWISYDLGIDGDYSSLYYWLDSKSAKECGSNVATLWYNYEKNFLSEFEKELKKNVRFRKTDRIYMIFKDTDNNNKIRGRFIIGKRKPAPWEGFASEEIDEVEDNEY